MALALAAATPAGAASPAVRIRVDAGPLTTTLREIARQTGTELLFDPNRMAGLRAARIDARTTPIAALQTALSGTDLATRRLPSGALIIERPAAPPMEQQDVAVSEVLIVGRRTQNADIRRTETDIQRYDVVRNDELLGAHVDTIGQFFDTHVSINANANLPGSQAASGFYSQIDLRGLGPNETLVLVDGRRMPSLPTSGPLTGLVAEFGFQQPDINPIPQHAVDRIETLTGTAGGIYGFGALGGVVNVVLKHDRPGAEIHLTTGISSRGDAGRYVLEGRLEFSPDDGATTVMLNGSLSRSERLRVGQRDYLETDRREIFRRAPPEYQLTTMTSASSITALSVFDEPLVLKPAYGGAVLNATYTYLPIGFEGTPQELGANLARRAGQVDLSLSETEAASNLATYPSLGSLLMNVRHRFSDDIEGYFDGIMLSNRGTTVTRGTRGATFSSPSSPSNPFEQYVYVLYPIDYSGQVTRMRFDSARFTLGVLAPMPHGWRSAAETTWGWARVQASATRLSGGVYIPEDVDPFGSWSAFQKVLLDDQTQGDARISTKSHYREASLRLAGPVFGTKLGRSTLTVLAEHREEKVPDYELVGAGNLDTYAMTLAPWSTATSSAYAEFRSAPFASSRFEPLRGFEAQLAVRHDRQSDRFSSPPTDPAAPRVHVDFAATTYTAGAKVSPRPWLMLRGSYATGRTPPALVALISRVDPSGFLFIDDPKRQGSNSLIIYEETAGGSPNLEAVHASTAAAGFMLTPFGPDGLRFSLDYSRILKTNDVQGLDPYMVVEHESDWPERVRRAPLTDEDKARGYTAGKIIAIDHSAINGGRRDIQTLDARLDWTFPLPKGALRFYGDTTYNLRNVQKSLYRDDVRTDGYLDGPLKWRANGGVEWALDSLTIGANIQYYGPYRIETSAEAVADEVTVLIQGANRISDQAYLDLRIRKRLQLRAGDVSIDLGVNNVLDTSPPRLSSWVFFTSMGYSPYGDPRRRRFELTVSAAF